MRVILKEDINGLGYQYDIVTVKPGYARNFLIPRGKAEIASPTAVKVRDEVVRQKAHKQEKIIKDANELATALEKVVLKFKMRAQDTGKTYGSVTAAMIADAIKEQFSYDVDKNNVLLGDNIKEIGESTVKIKVFKDIQPKITVVVEREMTAEEIAAEERAKAEAKKAEEERKAAEAKRAEKEKAAEATEEKQEENK